jgi:hypothetical protein
MLVSMVRLIKIAPRTAILIAYISVAGLIRKVIPLRAGARGVLAFAVVASKGAGVRRSIQEVIYSRGLKDKELTTPHLGQ